MNFLLAQNNSTLYKVEAQDQPLEEVLLKLQYDYSLLLSYKASDISPYRVNASIATKSITELFDTLLSNTEIGYEIVDDQFILLSPLEEVTVCGRLVDDEGVPLIGATIMVSNSDLGTVSDAQGYFSLTQKLSKSQTLELSYVGYESKSVLFSNFTKGNCPDVTLRLPVTDVPWLIITDYLTDGISKDNRSSSTVLSPAKINALPGQTEPDVLKTIQFLPGVASPSSKSSDLFVRGGTPDQNLIIWEDIPIYHSAHYFGMISAIDPFIVDEVEVYRGGFGPEYGGRVSSVIDIESISESSQASRFRVGSNMTHSYISGIEEWGSDKKTTVVYSLRRSFADIIKTPTYNKITEFNQQGFVLGGSEISELDHISRSNDFRFIDGHFKISSQLTEKDRVALSGLFADTYFRGDIVDSLRRSQEDVMELSNLGTSFNWDRQWTSALESSIISAYTDYNYNYDYVLTEFNSPLPKQVGVKSNGIKDAQFQTSFKYQFSPNNKIEAGYHFVNYDIEYKLVDRNPNNGSAGNSQLNVHSGFVNYFSSISERLNLDLGLRTSVLSKRNKKFLEPRVRVAYGLSDGLVLSGAYGRHNQYVSQLSEFRGSQAGLSLPIWGLTTDREDNREVSRDIDVPIRMADQYQIGFIIDKKGWLVDVQAYTKKVEGYTSRIYDIDNVFENDIQIGYIRSRGIDFLIKKRYKKIRSWLSYAYSQSTLNFEEEVLGIFPTDYDQRHVLQWANQFKFNKLELSLGLKWSSGLPFSVAEGTEIDTRPMPPIEVASYTGFNNGRLPSTTEWNFSAQYQFKPKNAQWNGFLGFSVVNLLDSSNAYSQDYYIARRLGQMSRLEDYNKFYMRLTPDLSLRFEW